MANADKCYFCDNWSEYNFTAMTPVCLEHWNMMYNTEAPSYVDASQILTFKRLAVEKQVWKA
jgi:hypothetical protein